MRQAAAAAPGNPRQTILLVRQVSLQSGSVDAKAKAAGLKVCGKRS